MLKSKNVTSVVVCAVSLKCTNSIKTQSTQFIKNLSHRDELSVGDNVFESVRIFDAERQLSGAGVVGQDGDDARGERQHHVAAHPHLAHGLVRATEVRVDDLVERHGQGNGVSHADCQRGRTPRRVQHSGCSEFQAVGAFGTSYDAGRRTGWTCSPSKLRRTLIN